MPCTILGGVIDLEADDFDDLVKEHATFIKFYSPSCPHCQKIAPLWEKVGNMAPSYPQSFMAADVDCSRESVLCDRVGVRGVPTLIFFADGKMYKYQGPREYNDIMKFGAGDYKLSTESYEIPARGGLIVTAQYSLVKFVKDLHAIIRFNYWAAIVIFMLGLMSGSLITFVLVMLTIRSERSPPQDIATDEGTESKTCEPEKEADAKKAD